MKAIHIYKFSHMKESYSERQPVQFIHDHVFLSAKLETLILVASGCLLSTLLFMTLS